MSKSDKPKHGGPRTPGPGKSIGRPRAAPDGLVRYTVRLRPDQIESLRTLPNASEVLRELIDQYFKER